MSTASSDRRPLLAAIALFATALIIRLFGITWGLPNDLHNDSLHPDERVVYFNYSYPSSGSAFLPYNYNYPSFYPIVLRVAGDMIATYGGMETSDTVPQLDFSKLSFKDLTAREAKIATHQRATNLAGRVLNCFAGAGTAVVVFFLLLRFSGLAGALFGGLLASIAPSLVVHSRFATVDVFSTFFMWLSILYAIKLYLNAEPSLDNRYAILAGVFAGLSAGTKYTGVVSLLSVFAALVLTRRTNWIRLAIVTAVACFVIFALSTPGFLLENSRFMFSFQSERLHMKEGHDVSFVHTPNGMLFQIGNLFTGIGAVAFVIGMLGLLYAAFRGRKWIWVVLASVLAYFLIVGNSEVKFVRYGLPLVPAVCVGFGYAINGLLQRQRVRLIGVAAGAVALGGLESLVLTSKPTPYWACFDARFGGAVGTFTYTQHMMKEDPRDSAARQVLALARSEPNASIGIFRVPWYWTVPVIKDTILLYNMPDLMQPYLSGTATPHVERLRDLPGARYAVLSTLETSPFDRIENAEQVPQIWRARYEELHGVLSNVHANFDVIAAYGGEAPIVEDLMHIQPKAYVLKHK